MTTEKYNSNDLENMFKGMTSQAIAECTFTSDLVGGVPAGDAGVKAFVEFQMKLTGEEAEKAVLRILSEEIGENKIPKNEGDELDERSVYGINVIRSDEHGPWLGNWMIKASLKAAFSRLGFFVKKKGSKGDVSEMGRVLAFGDSLTGPNERVHVMNGDGPAPTHFEKFQGRVSSPQGSKSIVHWSEVITAGARFSFEFRYADKNLKRADVASAFAAMQNIGLGSVKAMERGKFKIDSLSISSPD